MVEMNKTKYCICNHLMLVKISNILRDAEEIGEEIHSTTANLQLIG
jgi:hypothetical protein